MSVNEFLWKQALGCQ